MSIVVGYVPKPEGRAALHHAIDEARRRSTRLLVVNASRGDAYLDPGLASAQDLELVRSSLEQSGVEHDLRQQVRGKDPADEVIELAEEVGAGLIVIGMRRRTPVGKLLLGSTAQRILLDAPCPVLAVKSAY